MAQVWRVHLTCDDCRHLPDDGRRYEILEGELAVSPAPTSWHQILLKRLYEIVAAWARGGMGGEVLFAPVDVVLAYDTVVQPDLLWIAPARIPALLKDSILGAPDLVVEVLSRGTEGRDKGAKAALYARHGVREYWLIDDPAQSVSLLALEGDVFCVHASGTGDRPLTSSLDTRLVVVPADLFRR